MTNLAPVSTLLDGSFAVRPEVRCEARWERTAQGGARLVREWFDDAGNVNRFEVVAFAAPGTFAARGAS